MHLLVAKAIAHWTVMYILRFTSIMISILSLTFYALITVLFSFSMLCSSYRLLPSNPSLLFSASLILWSSIFVIGFLPSFLSSFSHNLLTSSRQCISSSLSQLHYLFPLCYLFCFPPLMYLFISATW